MCARTSTCISVLDLGPWFSACHSHFPPSYDLFPSVVSLID